MLGSVADAPAVETSTESSDAAEKVDRVLELIKGTDRGVNVTPALQQEVDSLLDELAEEGSTQEPRPLDNPLIYGNYEVAYVSTRKAPSQRGQPAGGRFRGRVGRKLFQTRRLCQSVLEPDTVTNKVEFAILGLLPGSIGLRGKLQPIGDKRDNVKVQFQPPRVTLPGGISLAIGPKSSVELATTYLDERVRIGLGSRGSLFVFTRGGEANAAGMDKVGLERTSPLGWALLLGALAGLAGAAAGLWSLESIPARAAGAAVGVFTVALAAVFWNGGIIADDEEPSAES